MTRLAQNEVAGAYTTVEWDIAYPQSPECIPYITLPLLPGDEGFDPALFTAGTTFDAGMFLQRERVLQQGEQDLAVQRDRLSKEEELEELE